MRRADILTTSYCDFLEIWDPQPPGSLMACPRLYMDCFTFTFTIINVILTGHSKGVSYRDGAVRYSG
jgi:hypothetical protein